MVVTIAVLYFLNKRLQRKEGAVILVLTFVSLLLVCPMKYAKGPIYFALIYGVFWKTFDGPQKLRRP